MKVYSDSLTQRDLDAASNIPAYYPEVKREWVGRLRERAYDVRLVGSSNRWRNSGVYGAESTRSATHDQHGEWMARLFEVDPDAIIVGDSRYEGRDDFHAQTEYRYARTSTPMLTTQTGRKR